MFGGCESGTIGPPLLGWGVYQKARFSMIARGDYLIMEHMVRVKLKIACLPQRSVFQGAKQGHSIPRFSKAINPVPLHETTIPQSCHHVLGMSC